ADDIIGTLACLMRDEGVRSAFITRDKDLAQLVRDGDLFWDYESRDQFGYHDIRRYYGVAPERFADYLALTGDTSDNIPGVPGIGPRTAAMLMGEYESLDELYADLERVAGLKKLRGARTLSERLREHRESAYLARQLTRITCDLDLGVGVEGLRRRAPDIHALGSLYDQLGFGPFLRKQGDRLRHLPCLFAEIASGHFSGHHFVG